VIAYVLSFQVLVFLGTQVAAQLARGGQDQGSLNLYAVYAYGMRPAQLGLLNTAAVCLSVPVPFLTGYLMDRFGRRAVIAPGFGAYAAALAIMSLTAFFPLPLTVFLVSYVLVQASFGATGGTMQVLGTDLSPAANRGRFFAIWRMLSQLGATVAPAGFALVAQALGYGTAFVYLGAFAVAVAVTVAAVLGETMRQADRAEEKPLDSSLSIRG
jgi:MFS family permease